MPRKVVVLKEVEDCKACPYLKPAPEYEHFKGYCQQAERYMGKSLDTIPGWCPFTKGGLNGEM